MKIESSFVMNHGMIIIIFIYQYTQCNVSKRRNHFDWFLTTQLVGGSLKIPILLVGQHADILALTLSRGGS